MPYKPIGKTEKKGILLFDPISKFAASGVFMLTFMIETSQNNHYRCVAFGAYGEKLHGTIHDNDLVVVKGMLQLNQFEDEEREEILVDSVNLWAFQNTQLKEFIAMAKAEMKRLESRMSKGHDLLLESAIDHPKRQEWSHQLGALYALYHQLQPCVEILTGTCYVLQSAKPVYKTDRILRPTRLFEVNDDVEVKKENLDDQERNEAVMIMDAILEELKDK